MSTYLASAGTAEQTCLASWPGGISEEKQKRQDFGDRMVWVWILTFLFTIHDTTPLGLLLVCEIEIQYFHEMKVSQGKVPRNMYDPEMTLSMLWEGRSLPGPGKGFLYNTWK